MTVQVKDLVVTAECGCVERYMPEMEDILGTLSYCATHQAIRDGWKAEREAFLAANPVYALVDSVVTAKQFAQQILHGHHNQAIRFDTPLCFCGLPNEYYQPEPQQFQIGDKIIYQGSIEEYRGTAGIIARATHVPNKKAKQLEWRYRVVLVSGVRLSMVREQSLTHKD